MHLQAGIPLGADRENGRRRRGRGRHRPKEEDAQMRARQVGLKKKIWESSNIKLQAGMHICPLEQSFWFITEPSFSRNTRLDRQQQLNAFYDPLIPPEDSKKKTELEIHHRP